MNLKKSPQICLIPRMSGIGGMVSFQQKFATGLAARGVKVSYELDDNPYDAVLVVGGTRHLGSLWRARKRGIPIVQRLDGMNWLHRIRHRKNFLPTGVRHYMRAEYGNLILSMIRARLATRIVYQSEFTRKWWQRVHGPTAVDNTVIYNGVDLITYNPQGSQARPADRYRVLLVEGSLMGGYEQGLEVAVKLVETLADAYSRTRGFLFELMVVGRVSPELRKNTEGNLRKRERNNDVILNWVGQLPGHKIPEVNRTAHLLYSADINAACPNSVIEALACGLPVVSFNTGALPELIKADSGIIVDYGGDPWKLEAPDLLGLSRGASEILDNQVRFRKAARRRAEDSFGLDKMVDAYLDFLMSP